MKFRDIESLWCMFIKPNGALPLFFNMYIDWWIIMFGSFLVIENYLPMALIGFKGLIDGFVTIGFNFNLLEWNVYGSWVINH